MDVTRTSEVEWTWPMWNIMVDSSICTVWNGSSVCCALQTPDHIYVDEEGSEMLCKMCSAEVLWKVHGSWIDVGQECHWSFRAASDMMVRCGRCEAHPLGP